MVGSHAKIVSVRFFTYRVQRYLDSNEVMCAGAKSLSIRSVYLHNSEDIYMYILNLSHLWICTQSCLLDAIKAYLNQMYSIPQFYGMDTS